LERVRLLLNAGADLNILDNWNRTPISYLSQFDGAEIAKLLFEHARGTLDLGIADVGGFTPIMTAIESNSYNILDFLLGVVDRDVLVKKNKKDETVLHLLMRCADEETLLLFLNHNLQHFRSEDLGCIDSQALTIQAAKDCRWNQESRDSMIANRIIEKIRCQDEACEDEFFDALEDLT
jgi:ankyrin repeat protein